MMKGQTQMNKLTDLISPIDVIDGLIDDDSIIEDYHNWGMHH